MENNNYYTPTLEDFRVGFEYEMWSSPLTEKFIALKTSSWSSFDGRWENNIWRTNNIRVPYLTKEQIETEGWVENFSDGNFYSILKKDQYILTYYFNDKILVISQLHPFDRTLYKGSCRCINDFRLIIKLLNI